ncbi:MAG: dienelactone hydrolase family protein [Candidatus Methylomirabilia bacterium]
MAGTTMVHYEDSCAPATPLTTLASGQTDRIGLETVTLTTTQFLTGVKEGKPVVVWGDLRLPREGAGRVPAVILVHGSEGVGRREARWAEELDEIGAATLILDSLTGRGFVGATSDLSSGALIADTYRALGLLSTHPRIDPTRIALMGFSRGGLVTLYANLTRFRRMHGPAGVEFAAYLPFYPGCIVDYIGGEQVSDRPIRIFHGSADDWTPIAPCREYADRLRRAGKDIQLTAYPGARHAFDDPTLPQALYRPEVGNASRCFFVERPEGQLVNRETGRPLDFDDPCFSHGATVGYDAHAHRRSVQAVKAFLKVTFKLGR